MEIDSYTILKVQDLLTLKKLVMKYLGRDSDWLGVLIFRKSMTSRYLKLNGRGAALNWCVKKQATVALSSSEAEYQGMAAAVQEALCLKRLQENSGMQLKYPIANGLNNQSYTKLCQNP